MNRRFGSSTASTVPSGACAAIAQPFAYRAEALMVVRLDIVPVAEQRREPRPPEHLHVVVCEHSGHLLVHVRADAIRYVLLEVAAARDIQHLRAAADRKQRHVAIERCPHQLQLEVVSLPHDAVRLGVRFRVVQLRVDVRAAGEDQPVHDFQRPLDVRTRRHEERRAARLHHAAHVVSRHERRIEVPRAPRRGREVRRDPDHRLHRLTRARTAARAPSSSPRDRTAPARCARS